MRRPGIRTVLLGLSLLMLALPIGGVVVLRVYESALVRQTETGLITQSALIAAQFRGGLMALAPIIVSSDYGRPISGIDNEKGAARSARIERDVSQPQVLGRWKPRPAVLDLATARILPIAVQSEVDGIADEFARKVGLEVQPILTEAQVTTLAGLRVVDYQGVVVATTGADMGHDLGHTVEMRSALNGEGMSVLRRRKSDEPRPSYASISRGSTLRVHVTTPVFVGDRVVGAVQAVRTPRTLGAALYANRGLLTTAVLALSAMALLAWLVTSYAIVRPLKELRLQSLRAIDGEPGAMTPLRRPVIRDIQQLSHAVSSMAQTLEQRADYMREFATHVSHEFKTPLTAMQGSIELLQDHRHTMSMVEQDRFLKNLEGDVERLQRLVAELLKLTAVAELPPATLTGSVHEAVDEVVISHAGHAIELIDPEAASHTPVQMATPTLVSVLSSIVGNSFEHGANAVTIQCESDEKALIVHVRDNGPGVSDDHHERIFEPFFTTRPEPAGHGLGLAVVASLVRSHGGTIRSRDAKTGVHIELRLKRTDASERQ